MQRVLATSALALVLCVNASAQSASLAPWFDSDGFFNKPGVELARASDELTTCRAEAARLKIVRNTNTQVGTATAFNADGSYNPAVSGAATGIASIMFAIQDARYNGSIEHVEFRDCAVALGYRHFRLNERDRTRFNAETDKGFAALVASETPADGRFNENEVARNYYSAEVTPTRYQNAPAPEPLVGAPTAETITTEGPEAGAVSDAADAPPAPAPPPSAPPPTGVISRLAPDAIATPQPGMAIVVASARQRSRSMEIPVTGDTFVFTRVTTDGRFTDLVQPTASFALRSHFNPERRRDRTLAGDFEAPRYSTYAIPAGRYVLSGVGQVNTCLGSLTFEVTDGDVAYLGDFLVVAPSLPVGSLFNPLSNVNTSLDNRMRGDLRMAIGEDIEGARQALQADADAKARLTHVHYQNDYRVPCSGRYIGRLSNADWPSIGAAQANDFHQALAASIAAAR